MLGQTDSEGLPPEGGALVDAEEEKRRADNRERQRRWRERHGKAGSPDDGEGEKSKEGEDGGGGEDEGVPLSEAFRVAVVLPALVDIVAKARDDGRLWVLNTQTPDPAPFKAAKLPPPAGPLTVQVGVAADKALDALGLRIGPFEAALIETAMASAMCFMLYQNMPVMPVAQAQEMCGNAAPPKK